MIPHVLFDRVTRAAVAVVASSLLVPAIARAQYQQPPAPISQILDQPGTPVVLLSPDKANLLVLSWPGLPSIRTVAAFEYRLAGRRFDPKTSGPSRGTGYTAISVQPVSGGAARPVAVPLSNGASIGDVIWSPDARRLAFTVSSDSAITLWMADVASASATRVSDRRLNAVLGRPCAWVTTERLACTFVPEGRGAEPLAPSTPNGPIVQEAISGRAERAATYQDLLKSPHDEAVFEHYAMSELALVALDGAITPLGAPAVRTGIDPSPDGRYLLVSTIVRPFSYTVPLDYFPTRTEVWTTSGQVVKTVADRPLIERVPWGGGSALTGPRNITWRSDADATLAWTEALDGGDPATKAAKRDRVLLLPAPFTGTAATLVETEFRATGITWDSPTRAIARELDAKTRRTRTWLIDPSGTTAPRMLWDRSAEDRYGDPGDFLTTRDARGRLRLMTTANGRQAFLTGAGASAEGDRPFLDRYDLASGRSTRLYRSAAPYFETITGVLDANGTRVVTRRESKTEAPNYYVRDLVRKVAPRALTSFADPAPQFAGVTSQRITYTRKDGVKLSATVYLPPGYDRAKDGAIPFVLWAYPLEFRSVDAASQVTGSPYRFTRPSGMSHLFLLTQGYGVMDDPTMPIVAMNGKEPNDSYVEQLTMSAQAAVDTIVAMGVADRDRIGVGGHSYGAFMTANLLGHTRLFKAGIARSGAYNRTLTPFGFQGEERSYWEAPDLYERMSPFTYANRIKDPILLIHGMADNNTGTFPMQSERMYQALKGNGATVRYVQLPGESHGYSARESVGHTLAEMTAWLDKYLKKARTAM